MCWNTSSAFTPVALALRGPATRKIVRTLGDAAYLLLKDWPCDDGEEYVAAVKACVDAITGKIAPEQFREALLRAADEAGITALIVVQQALPERQMGSILPNVKQALIKRQLACHCGVRLVLVVTHVGRSVRELSRNH